MTPLRQKMMEDMQLRGLADKTQDAYLRAVRQLAEYYGSRQTRSMSRSCGSTCCI